MSKEPSVVKRYSPAYIPIYDFLPVEKKAHHKQEPKDRTGYIRRLKNFMVSALIVDLLLFNTAFITMNLVKRSSYVPEGKYFNLFLLLNALVLVVSIVFKKYHLRYYANIRRGITHLATNVILLLYAAALVIALTHSYHFSRLQVFGTFGIYFILNLSAFFVFYKAAGRNLALRFNDELLSQLKPVKLSYKLLSFDFLILTCSYFLLNLYKRGTLNLSNEYEQILLVFYAVWLIAGLFTRKFEKREYDNIYYSFAPFIKSLIIMAALLSVSVFALQIFDYSRLHIFGTLFIFGLLEFPLYYFYQQLGFHEQADLEDYQTVKQVLSEENENEFLSELRGIHTDNFASVKKVLRDRYLIHNRPLFEFINQHINLNHIHAEETSVFSTHTEYNINVLKNHSLSMLINLHQINDFRWLNRYFLDVHRKIYNGGYFIGQVKTISTHNKWFFKKFPPVIANILYPFNFLYNRIMPKLPGLQRIYFFITRGRNRLISKAEALGRLYFCGFRIIAVREIEDKLFYIAQRIKNPKTDRNPSYGPIVRLKRVGYNGKIFTVYKFRTMHPYSEYLQEYIYENYGTTNGDKFNNDFRVTTWGDLLRKFWIDELPMLINLIRGEIALVGVRPLSIQKFSIYRNSLKDKRTKFKPGLVPPFYADLPNSLEGLMDSEENYLDQKALKPFTTDVKYFWKAFYNIAFRHARSQ